MRLGMRNPPSEASPGHCATRIQLCKNPTTTYKKRRRSTADAKCSNDNFYRRVETSLCQIDGNGCVANTQKILVRPSPRFCEWPKTRGFARNAGPIPDLWQRASAMLRARVGRHQVRCQTRSPYRRGSAQASRVRVARALTFLKPFPRHARTHRRGSGSHMASLRMILRRCLCARVRARCVASPTPRQSWPG